MSAAVAVAILGGGFSSMASAVVGYFWYNKCDRHDNAEDCNDMDACQWDTYATKPECISIDDNLTPNNLTPGDCSTLSTITSCNSNASCQWDTSASKCMSHDPVTPCSEYGGPGGSQGQCAPHFDRCHYDWYAPVGQPKCIPISQALTPAPACSTYKTSFTCGQTSDRCHWDPYNAAGSKCVPFSTPLTPAPPTGVCSVRTATENNNYIGNMTHWGGHGLLAISTWACNQRTTEPTCTSTSDNVFLDSDGITWDLYTEGYKNTKYNDVCKWVVA